MLMLPCSEFLPLKWAVMMEHYLLCSLLFGLKRYRIHLPCMSVPFCIVSGQKAVTGECHDLANMASADDNACKMVLWSALSLPNPISSIKIRIQSWLQVWRGQSTILVAFRKAAQDKWSFSLKVRPLAMVERSTFMAERLTVIGYG